MARSLFANRTLNLCDVHGRLLSTRSAADFYDYDAEFRRGRPVHIAPVFAVWMDNKEVSARRLPVDATTSGLR